MTAMPNGDGGETCVIEAHVPTGNGSRYLQQLCKHWSHKFEVSFDPKAGQIAFPSGAVARFVASDASLLVRIEAPDVEIGQRMTKVLSEHLDRFAFREAPLDFDWKRFGDDAP